MTETGHMSKRLRAITLFSESEGLFSCPLCRSGLKVSAEGSVQCAQKHSFDFSRKGYVNLSGFTESERYDSALFESRRQVFAAGFFDPLVEAVCGVIQAGTNENGKMIRVLDAGCGEGFFLHAVRQRLKAWTECRLYGVDLSRDAVSCATGYDMPACLMVADLANLPFRDQTMDCILNILSPANYREFGRVLKKDGIVIKVVPEAEYLAEIRQVLLSRDKVPYSNQPVRAHWNKTMQTLFCKELYYKKPVTEEQAAWLFKMTPMSGHMTGMADVTRRMGTVTMHFTVLAGRVL